MIKKILRTLLISLCGLVLVTMISCSGFQDFITPAYIPPSCIEYSELDVPIMMPYTTIVDAEYVDAGMDFQYDVGKLEYKWMKGQLSSHLEDAREFQQIVFDPAGPLGLLLPALGGLGLGAYLIPRPKEKELAEKLNGSK